MTESSIPSIQVYNIPMPAPVTVGFYASAALMATAVAWCFKSGMTVTAICLIAVMAPLCVLYWYMLVHSPAESSIAIAEGELHVNARPFLKISQPLAAVQRAYHADMRDEGMPERTSTRSMNMFGYTSGVFALPGDKELVVLTRGRKILVLETAERDYYLGPKDMQGLAEGLSAAGIAPS
jgi:hypothetical protein